MTMRLYTFLSAAILLIISSCNAQKQEADLILSNGRIYTVDEEFSITEAIAIKDHRIVALGSSKEILKEFNANEVRDLDGAYVYPGWIDDDTVHFLASRPVYGTAGKNLTLITVGADGKGRKDLQTTIDSAVAK